MYFMLYERNKISFPPKAEFLKVGLGADGILISEVVKPEHREASLLVFCVGRSW